MGTEKMLFLLRGSVSSAHIFIGGFIVQGGYLLGNNADEKYNYRRGKQHGAHIRESVLSEKSVGIVD